MLLLTLLQTEALVHLQSITIVFLKVILTNVSAMVNQANGQSGQSKRYVTACIVAEGLTEQVLAIVTGQSMGLLDTKRL